MKAVIIDDEKRTRELIAKLIDSFELNIESPFKFNEVYLTDEAQKAFLDFIKSIKRGGR